MNKREKAEFLAFGKEGAVDGDGADFFRLAPVTETSLTRQKTNRRFQ